VPSGSEAAVGVKNFDENGLLLLDATHKQHDAKIPISVGQYNV
jgi:hypothetical protein